MTEQSSRWLTERVSGVILAGGKNSRMGGRDKAFLRVGGEPVVVRALAVLRACFRDVVVVSNCPDKYAGLDVAVTADEFPGQGPLAGIHAGLGRVRTPYAFVTACDMPFLRPEPIRYLGARLAERVHADAAPPEALVPWWDGDLEPLHGFYATALRPRIATALEAGQQAIRALLPVIDCVYVTQDDLRDVCGAEESFRNVNTPEEAARFAVDLP